MNLPLWELLEHLDPQQRVDFPGPSSFMPTQQCCRSVHGLGKTIPAKMFNVRLFVLFEQLFPGKHGISQPSLHEMWREIQHEMQHAASITPAMPVLADTLCKASRKNSESCRNGGTNQFLSFASQNGNTLSRPKQKVGKSPAIKSSFPSPG